MTFVVLHSTAHQQISHIGSVNNTAAILLLAAMGDIRVTLTLFDIMNCSAFHHHKCAIYHNI